jgi:hypothetical protein
MKNRDEISLDPFNPDTAIPKPTESKLKKTQDHRNWVAAPSAVLSTANRRTSRREAWGERSDGRTERAYDGGDPALQRCRQGTNTTSTTKSRTRRSAETRCVTAQNPA